MIKKILSSAVLASMLSFALPAFALHSATDYTLFGEASYAAGNASARGVHLISDNDPAFAGISFTVEAGTTFADLTYLGTDMMFEADDSCVGGSPRFSVRVDTGAGLKNIFVYLGPAPNYSGCAAGVWMNSGDVLESGLTVDTGQLPGGTFYHSYDSALAAYGAYPVMAVSLVADASWAFGDGEQALTVDNTLINSTMFDYEIPVAETKDQCKNGGWQGLANASGGSFKNQGDCVSFVASKGKAN